MLKVYISGPYRASNAFITSVNIQDARLEAALWWGYGANVFCPHLNSAFMDGVTDDDNFLRGDLEWLQYANLLVLLPRWANSDGANAEKDLAQELNIQTISRNNFDANYRTHWPTLGACLTIPDVVKLCSDSDA